VPSKNVSAMSEDSLRGRATGARTPAGTSPNCRAIWREGKGAMGWTETPSQAPRWPPQARKVANGVAWKWPVRGRLRNHSIDSNPRGPWANQQAAPPEFPGASLTLACHPRFGRPAARPPQRPRCGVKSPRAWSEHPQIRAELPMAIARLTGGRSCDESAGDACGQRVRV